MTEPLTVRLIGGTDASCYLSCYRCDEDFMTNSGGWYEDPADPDVPSLPAAELIRLLTEHQCAKET